jgi:hypothetical protein
VEWLVLSVSMMGWLSKAMNALGVPLELPTAAEVADVIGASGWTPGKHLAELPPPGPPPRADSLLTRLGVVRYAPQALRLDKLWTAGVPDRWPAVGDYLRQHTGHPFPVLSRLRHRRAIRAIATMIRESLAESVVGKDEKLAAGLVYAETVAAPSLADELRALGARALPDSPVQALARAIAPTPSQVDAAVIEACRPIPAAGIVEVVSFLSTLQMLYRLGTYYPG